MKRIWLIFSVATLLLAGCQTGPGGAKANLFPGAFEIKQPQSPKEASRQEIEYYQAIPLLSSNITLPASCPVTNTGVIYLKTRQEVSGSFFDRAAGALREMRAAQIAGILFFALWIFSLTPIGFQVFGASLTTRLALLVAAAFLTFGPMLVAGNEKLILFSAGGVVLIWFLAHRHGEHKAKADLLDRVANGSPTKD